MNHWDMGFHEGYGQWKSATLPLQFQSASLFMTLSPVLLVAYWDRDDPCPLTYLKMWDVQTVSRYGPLEVRLAMKGSSSEVVELLFENPSATDQWYAAFLRCIEYAADQGLVKKEFTESHIPQPPINRVQRVMYRNYVVDQLLETISIIEKMQVPTNRGGILQAEAHRLRKCAEEIPMPPVPGVVAPSNKSVGSGGNHKDVMSDIGLIASSAVGRYGNDSVLTHNQSQSQPKVRFAWEHTEDSEFVTNTLQKYSSVQTNNSEELNKRGNEPPQPSSSPIPIQQVIRTTTEGNSTLFPSLMRETGQSELGRMAANLQGNAMLSSRPQSGRGDNTNNPFGPTTPSAVNADFSNSTGGQRQQPLGPEGGQSIFTSERRQYGGGSGGDGTQGISNVTGGEALRGEGERSPSMVHVPAKGEIKHTITFFNSDGTTVMTPRERIGQDLKRGGTFLKYNIETGTFSERRVYLSSNSQRICWIPIPSSGMEGERSIPIGHVEDVIPCSNPRAPKLPPQVDMSRCFAFQVSGDRVLLLQADSSEDARYWMQMWNDYLFRA